MVCTPANSSDQCIPDTVEITNPIGDVRFELRCRRCGVIATYSPITVRQLGARALQHKLDVAWLTHAASPAN